jgi:hypothetical protein
MNLSVLQFLLDNDEYIKEMAKEANVDPDASIGIVKLLFANNGDLDVLKGKQPYHYKNVIQPLLEGVECNGAIGMIDDENGCLVTSCVNGGIVDDESLYQSYLEEDFKCQICRFDFEKMRQ